MLNFLSYTHANTELQDSELDRKSELWTKNYTTRLCKTMRSVCISFDIVRILDIPKLGVRRGSNLVEEEKNP